MSLSFTNANYFTWTVRKIAVIGPGIVGMPMAALLAHARIQEGSDIPARVQVIQRNSKTSGWKVAAINRGESVIGGVEPALDGIVADSVKQGILSATHDYQEAADADVILVCVQTDKKGFSPDYGPLFEALGYLAQALKNRPEGNIPLIIFESTLAPSSMATVIKEHFKRYGLEEGRDILLGNSPNRVMPGRLVERVAAADKLVAGLHPLTPQLIQRLYSRIVTKGALHITNSMTAEIVKTLENAYRDVRIAFSAEVVRYCDQHDIDFYAIRDAVNDRLAQNDLVSQDAAAIPSGAMLVPTLGVGGHCLPKDGILLWWRLIESGADTACSLILQSRLINDESPQYTIKLAEERIGKLAGMSVALLGMAYRPNSEDTRNSPTLALASELLRKDCRLTIHDPYVRLADQNLERFKLTPYFTNQLTEALQDAEVVFLCTSHGVYQEGLGDILKYGSKVALIVDGVNLYQSKDFVAPRPAYAGIGRGHKAPSASLIDFVEMSFRAMEQGVANELSYLIRFLNDHYADSNFNRVDFEQVRQLAATCVTGCVIAQPNTEIRAPSFEGFQLRLATCAEKK